LIDTYQETSIGNQSLDITSLGEEGTGAYVVSSVRKAKKESRRSRAKKKLLNSYTGLQHLLHICSFEFSQLQLFRR